MAKRNENSKKIESEKFQAILTELLKDDDNKYCVDCDAKGPRWASWNLGIFLCIRCAGIHRNLGVHISRVKSVNLDSWTAEQIAMVQEMGNSRARAVYEANLPDHFRRPQTDSSLEAFIRAKYEQKKYIAKEWVAPQKPTLKIPAENKPKNEKISRPKQKSNAVTGPLTNTNTTSVNKSEETPKVTSASADLLVSLGDDSPVSNQINNNILDNEIFGEFVTTENVKKNDSDDLTDVFSNDKTKSVTDNKLTTKDILSLYSNMNNQPNSQVQQQPQQMYTQPSNNSSYLYNNGMNYQQGNYSSNQAQHQGMMHPAAFQQQQQTQQQYATNQQAKFSGNFMGNNMVAMQKMQQQMTNMNLSNQPKSDGFQGHFSNTASFTGQTLSNNLWR